MPSAFKHQGDADGFFLILCVFVAHYEFPPQGQTYGVLSWKLCNVFMRQSGKKRHDAWWEKRWMLLHDMPAHSLFLVHDFLAKHETTVLTQPLFSLDLAPAYFFCFPS